MVLDRYCLADLSFTTKAHMLKEEPHKRPNIYQVLREACHMRGKEVPIRDVS